MGPRESPLPSALVQDLHYLPVAGLVTLTGAGVVRLLSMWGQEGEARPGSAALFLLSPLAGLATWTVSLNVTVVFGFRAGAAFVPVLLLSGALCAVGLLPLYRSKVWLLGLALVLPALPLAPFFVAGLQESFGAGYPDGFNYAVAAEKLWRYPLDAPVPGVLWQFADVFDYGRFTSMSVLGFLSHLLNYGDAQSAAGLLRALALLSLAGATIYFGQVVFGRPWHAAGLGVLSVLCGWAFNPAWIASHDNLLFLAYPPAMIGLASTLGTRGQAALLGFLAAAAVYTFAELSPFLAIWLVAVVLARAMSRRRWDLPVVAAAVAVTILAPYVPHGAEFLRSQTDRATTLGRLISGGLLDGYADPGAFFGAFWGLGGEWSGVVPGAADAPAVPVLAFQLLGIVLTLLAVAGAVEEWRLAPARLLPLPLFLAAVFYYAFPEDWGYAAYKVTTLVFWYVIYLALRGALAVPRLLPANPGPVARRGLAAASAALLAGVLAAGWVFHVSSSDGWQLPGADQPFSYYASVRAIEPLVAGKQVQIIIPQPIEDAWTNYLLRDNAIYDQEHPGFCCVDPGPAPPVDYYLTLAGANIPANLRVWAGGPYELFHAR